MKKIMRVPSRLFESLLFWGRRWGAGARQPINPVREGLIEAVAHNRGTTFIELISR
ncbi:hypothetical protein ABER23_20415 [Paenibacillus lautus]|uniref:hypothetical protein n=1 Tax=Paenibacillus lautus TaxID=1401 RepID=UPI003D28B6CF